MLINTGSLLEKMFCEIKVFSCVLFAFIFCIILAGKNVADSKNENKKDSVIKEGILHNMLHKGIDGENCQKLIFKQVIIKEGCHPTEFTNHICAGSCKTSHKPSRNYANQKETGFTCSSCVPSKYNVSKIELKCPGRKKKKRIKKKLVVSECKCKQTKCESM